MEVVYCLPLTGPEMEESNSLSSLIRFGIFEVELQAGELRKQGFKVKLQEQPFQVLVMLLERRGEVVTRDELKRCLWPSDTYVDFEGGLNRRSISCARRWGTTLTARVSSRPYRGAD